MRTHLDDLLRWNSSEGGHPKDDSTPEIYLAYKVQQIYPPVLYLRLLCYIFGYLYPNGFPDVRNSDQHLALAKVKPVKAKTAIA
jgi:hypothetical protein